MKFHLTITVATQEIYPHHVLNLLTDMGVTHELSTLSKVQTKDGPRIIGTFSADVGRNAQYALQNIVDQLQQRVLDHYGRYLVTAKGTAIVETPVEHSNPWIIMTDEQRAEQYRADVAKWEGDRFKHKAQFIDKLRKLNVAKVTWSVYWEDDQNECEGTTLLDINDCEIEAAYDGNDYDELLDYYAIAIDEEGAEVGIDTGSYELRLLTDEGAEMEELHYIGRYDHDYNGY